MTTFQNSSPYLSLDETMKQLEKDKTAVYNQVEEGLPAYLGRVKIEPFQLWTLKEEQRSRFRFLAVEVERWKNGEPLREYVFTSMQKPQDKFGLPKDVIKLVTSWHKEVVALYKGMTDRNGTYLQTPDTDETELDAYRYSAIKCWKDNKWEFIKEKHLKEVRLFLPDTKDEDVLPNIEVWRRDFPAKLYQVMLSDELISSYKTFSIKKLHKLHVNLNK